MRVSFYTNLALSFVTAELVSAAALDSDSSLATWVEESTLDSWVSHPNVYELTSLPVLAQAETQASTEIMKTDDEGDGKKDKDDEFGSKGDMK